MANAPARPEVWFDHSGDASLGWTMTMSIQQGYFFMAFLAIMVTIAGSSAWTIASLVLHNHLAHRGADTDVFGIQHQVTLRNSPGALRTIVDTIQIHRSWSGTPIRRRWTRTLVILLPALLLWGAFLYASLSVAKVATRSTDRVIVKVASNDCGIALGSAGDDLEDFQQDDKWSNIWRDHQSRKRIAARAYANTFYQTVVGNANGEDLGSARSPFIQASLPYTLHTEDVPCLFPRASYCLKNYTIALETEPLDSHYHLGINAPVADRVSIQRKTTCSIMTRKNIKNTTEGWDYNIGRINPSKSNTTYTHPHGDWWRHVSYQIKTAQYLAHLPLAAGLWRPIGGIRRNDSDMSAIFLSQNGVKYPAEVADPLFEATNEVKYINSTRDEDDKEYRSDYLVKTLVCGDQYRWCSSSDSERCTEYTGSRGLEVAATDGERNTLDWNIVQRATAARLATTGTYSIANSIVFMNTGALYVNSKLYHNVASSRLPPNQWHIEVSGWFETVLAQMQTTVIDFAYKPPKFPFRVVSPAIDANETDKAYLSRLNLTDDMVAVWRDQCHSQLIQGTGDRQNFSLVGVVLIIVLTIIVMQLAFWLPDILDWISRRRHSKDSVAPPGVVARMADHRLHLVSLGLASSSVVGNGDSQWKLARTGIPVLAAAGHGEGNGARDPGDKHAEVLVAGDCAVARPVLEGGLAVYKRGNKDAGNASWDSETARML